MNHGTLWTTLLACATLVAGLVTLLHRVTGGFEHWTLEEARRAAADGGRLRAPSIPLRTEHGTSSASWGDASSEAAIHVVDFIYTRCPAVCQTLGNAFQRMQADIAREAGGPASIRLLSMSIDPGHDGPRELAAYALQHDADAQVWTVAAPRTAQDMARLLRSLRIIVIPDGSGGYVHNGSIHLVDRRGTVRAIYDHDAWEQALRHAKRLAEAHP